MTNTNEIKNIVEKMPQHKEKLFMRGFYFTNSKIKENKYPFYNQWKKITIDNFTIMHHKKQSCYFTDTPVQDKKLILIGHAYNPFTMEYDETTILNKLLKMTEENFWKTFNELSGVFCLIIIKDNIVKCIGDPTGMLNVYYTSLNGNLYISSHSNLIASLNNLQQDLWIKKLTNYKFFSYLGVYLPGDYSPFTNIKLLIPNHYLLYKKDTSSLEIKRFYIPHFLKVSQKDIVDQSNNILCNSMNLITKKWSKPAISLTGGCDSRTTLACANKLYNKYYLYSYSSNESENVDALAAHKLCKTINLSHKIYSIPLNNDEIDDYSINNKIMEWNYGNIGPRKTNDVRKRSILYNTKDFDIELKSLVSEGGRCYYSKRFNRKNFGNKPTPRKCTCLYKFFITNRKLLYETDRAFKQFIIDYYDEDKNSPIPWEEWFLWEYMWPCKNGLIVTAEQKFSNDITIPYNNRILYSLILSAEFEDKLNDLLFEQIRNIANPAINANSSQITNLKHTKNRSRLENLYYIINSHIPF